MVSYVLIFRHLVPDLIRWFLPRSYIRSGPYVFRVIYAKTSPLQILKEVRVISDCFNHSCPQELSRKLRVKTSREITEHEVPPVNLFAGRGVEYSRFLVVP